jgi:hypothetical protein
VSASFLPELRDTSLLLFYHEAAKRSTRAARRRQRYRLAANSQLANGFP